jgi:hypothetical protein
VNGGTTNGSRPSGGGTGGGAGGGSGGTALRRLIRARPGPAAPVLAPTAGPTAPTDPAGPPGPAAPSASGRPVEGADPGERCEMCGTAIGEPHSHVVHLEHRSLLCTCRPCALLFAERGAGRGRYRTVPDRYLRDPAMEVTEAQWDELRVPVRMAFFFRNSDQEQVLAFYPSPAGATESLLPMDAWDEGLGASRLARELEPDVEALLIARLGGDTTCLLVPIDACYELVGLVRTYWKGFDGGAELWEHVGGFLAGLSDRSREVRG